MKWMKKHHILISFILAHVLFLIMSILLSNIKLMNGYDIFDLKMIGGYDLNYALQIKSQLNQASLNHYLYIQIPLDMIYPIVVAYFFYTFINKYSKYRYIAYLSLLSLVFDYLENILVIYILKSYDLSQSLVSFASLMTQAKGIMYILNYGICVIISIIFLTKRRKVQP